MQVTNCRVRRKHPADPGGSDDGAEGVQLRGGLEIKTLEGAGIDGSVTIQDTWASSSTHIRFSNDFRNHLDNF